MFHVEQKPSAFGIVPRGTCSKVPEQVGLGAPNKLRPSALLMPGKRRSRVFHRVASLLDNFLTLRAFLLTL